MKRYLAIFALMILTLLAAAAVGRAAPPPVYYLDAVGTVNPGMAEFILAGIDKAEEQQAQALVVQLDTPGGWIPPCGKSSRASPTPGCR